MFLAAAEDGVVEMYRHDLDLLDQTMPGLRAKTLIAGAGHCAAGEIRGGEPAPAAILVGRMAGSVTKPST
jgi:hypothetical protein